MADETLAQHPLPRLRPPHEHGWITESRHGTSEGVVVYARCVDCGARRVEVAPPTVAPPMPASVVVGA